MDNKWDGDKKPYVCLLESLFFSEKISFMGDLKTEEV